MSSGTSALPRVVVSLVLLAACVVGTVHGQVVRGVVHAANGEPLADISAVLLDDAGSVVRGTLTEPDGSFAMSAPPGTYRLRVGSMGYATWDSAPLELAENEEIEQRVVLFLEGEVTALADFERRRASEDGTFLTYPDFADRAGPGFYAAFQLLPGIVWSRRSFSLVTGRSGADRAGAQQRGEPSSNCPPVLYVDGVWWGRLGESDLSAVPSNQMLAIEIYQRNEVPEEFRVNRDAACGVIVVWRKNR